MSKSQALSLLFGCFAFTLCQASEDNLVAYRRLERGREHGGAEMHRRHLVSAADEDFEIGRTHKFIDFEKQDKYPLWAKCEKPAEMPTTPLNLQKCQLFPDSPKVCIGGGGVWLEGDILQLVGGLSGGICCYGDEKDWVYNYICHKQADCDNWVDPDFTGEYCGGMFVHFPPAYDPDKPECEPRKAWKRCRFDHSDFEFHKIRGNIKSGKCKEKAGEPIEKLDLSLCIPREPDEGAGKYCTDEGGAWLIKPKSGMGYCCFHDEKELLTQIVCSSMCPGDVPYDVKLKLYCCKEQWFARIGDGEEESYTCCDNPWFIEDNVVDKCLD